MKFTGIENKKYWDDFFKRGGWYSENLSDFMKGWNKRERHIPIRGFVILTKETLAALTDILTGHNTLDLGAGTGYMMYHLRKNNICVDGVVDKKGRYKFKRNHMTKRIITANYLELDISKYDAFIFSWPDYQSDAPKKFLDRMKSGDKLVYQGEGEGGCCADYDFFETLDSDFVELHGETYALNKHHVQFEGIHDRWSVYVKR